MAERILRDAVGITSTGGVSRAWARSPYGIRLVEDPTKAFKTLAEVERYVLAEDGGNEEVSRNVNEWFNILEKTEMSNNAEMNRDGYQDTLAPGKSLYTSPNYTDTRVGGNDAINPYWQFNRDDDITPALLRMPGMEAFSSGMGRVYAEMYDDNQEILWMRMGVPEFVNVLSFYASSGDVRAASAMNSGSLRSLVGKIVRMVFSTAIWAITFPITAPFILSRWVSRINTERITKYYYFKPAMTLYYEMCNTMLSYLAVNMGLYPMFWLQRKDPDKILPNNEKNTTPSSGTPINQGTPSEIAGNAGYENRTLTAGQLDEAAKSGAIPANECGVPAVLKDGPDIFVIMNRRARLFNAQRVNVTTRQLLEETLSNDQTNSMYFESPQGKYEVDSNGNRVEVKDSPTEGVWSKWFSALKGTAFGAGDFVGFRIERGLDCSESVSNQTGPTGISQQLNSLAQQKRDEYENVGNSFFAKTIKSMAEKGPRNALKDLGIEALSQVASAVGVGDIAAILTQGNGFIDIPEVWKGSTYNKSYSFTIQLRARYGDPTSIFQSIYIPLVMLLNAAMPRAIGDNMYTSPFVINAYCKGKFAVPCGMITDMTIRRGKDEFGWNNTNLPTAVDVSFSIHDLSPAMFLSMQDIGFFDTFSRNNALMEYLDTLSALGITERLYFWSKAMRKLTAAVLIKKNTIFSSTYWGSKMGRSNVVRALVAAGPFANYEQSDIQYNQSRSAAWSGGR